MAQKGWNAKGKLTPLYARFGARKGLSEAAGVPESTLSGINSGSRPLGLAVARRLEAATGVTLVDLGAPLNLVADDPASRLIQERLDVLEGRQAKITQRLSRVEKAQARIAELQKANRQGDGQVGGQQ